MHYITWYQNERHTFANHLLMSFKQCLLKYRISLFCISIDIVFAVVDSSRKAFWVKKNT